jgi:hypothetical protein
MSVFLGGEFLHCDDEKFGEIFHMQNHHENGGVFFLDNPLYKPLPFVGLA